MDSCKWNVFMYACFSISGMKLKNLMRKVIIISLYPLLVSYKKYKNELYKILQTHPYAETMMYWITQGTTKAVIWIMYCPEVTANVMTTWSNCTLRGWTNFITAKIYFVLIQCYEYNSSICFTEFFSCSEIKVEWNISCIT